MEVKCPECGCIKEIQETFGTLKLIKQEDMVMILCQSCLNPFYPIDNIVYEPPTGGAGEIDPNQSPVNNISLRDYFAGQAMAGALSASLEITKAEIQRDPSVFFDAEKIKTISDEHIYRTARDSFILADAMLKERDK